MLSMSVAETSMRCPTSWRTGSSRTRKRQARGGPRPASRGSSGAGPPIRPSPERYRRPASKRGSRQVHVHVKISFRPRHPLMRSPMAVLERLRSDSGASRNGRLQLAELPSSYKWIALTISTLGVLMATIDSSIVLIALPDVFRGIGLDPLQPGNTFYLLWMILGFLVITSVLVVSLGRMG